VFDSVHENPTFEPCRDFLFTIITDKGRDKGKTLRNRGVVVVRDSNLKLETVFRENTTSGKHRGTRTSRTLQSSRSEKSPYIVDVVLRTNGLKTTILSSSSGSVTFLTPS